MHATFFQRVAAYARNSSYQQKIRSCVKPEYKPFIPYFAEQAFYGFLGVYVVRSIFKDSEQSRVKKKAAIESKIVEQFSQKLIEQMGECVRQQEKGIRY